MSNWPGTNPWGRAVSPVFSMVFEIQRILSHSANEKGDGGNRIHDEEVRSQQQVHNNLMPDSLKVNTPAQIAMLGKMPYLFVCLISILCNQRA